MGSVSDALNLGDIKFFDGAMGSLLIEKGVRPSESSCCGVLNITNSRTIVDIHKAYIEVGSEYITTNTFLANKFMLEGSGFTVEEVISSGINNVKQAILESGKNNTKVVQSISMGGKFNALGEEYSYNQAYELFKEQVLIGEKYGTDVYLFETFLDLEELKAGVLACKENSNKPIFVTMPFGGNGENNGKTLVGVSGKEFAKTFDELGVHAIGVNCCFGSDMIVEVLKEIKEYTNKKIIVQPNRGIPTVLGGVTTYDVDKYEFLEEVKKICEVGVDFVGGCCGVTPEVMGLVIEWVV